MLLTFLCQSYTFLPEEFVRLIEFFDCGIDFPYNVLHGHPEALCKLQYLLAISGCGQKIDQGGASTDPTELRVVIIVDYPKVEHRLKCLFKISWDAQ